MRAAWPRLTENVTIDVGVMEKASGIAVIPISVGWNDIGSWSQVTTLYESDEHGNTIVSDGSASATSRHIGVNTTDTLVYSATGRLITTAGVEGLIIVDTPTGLLICAKEHAQLVKDIADRAQANSAATPAPSLDTPDPSAQPS
jgi:mannose-1-phosphate guanylyltransferase